MTAFGVYVHVPFCARRCDYCAFATWADRFHLAGSYVGACLVELGRAVGGGMPEASSLFFGGGTPSLLSPADLGSIVESVPLRAGAEVTVECNPETVDEAKLRGYAAVGVTRLSFGVQSMAPHVLAALGRRHDVASVARAVDAAGRAGFPGRYSVDLIFGAAGESVADWASTVAAALALGPSHVSAYALTVETGTPLARDPARHPDPDDQASKYELADDLLGAAGLEWYEISNWAYPGSECRHNQLYWAQGEYRGIGCAAHSHRLDPATGGSRRWWNVRTPERYIRLVEGGRPAESAGEDLDAGGRGLERLELSLRTRAGVPASSVSGWATDPALDGLLAPGPGDRLVLTRRGRLLANEVALRLQA
ncbi:MAG: radical SAM family heme chaperone HemW [Acidimicrobiales bacterium]